MKQPVQILMYTFNLNFKDGYRWIHRFTIHPYWCWFEETSLVWLRLNLSGPMFTFFSKSSKLRYIHKIVIMLFWETFICQRILRLSIQKRELFYNKLIVIQFRCVVQFRVKAGRITLKVGFSALSHFCTK